MYLSNLLLVVALCLSSSLARTVHQLKPKIRWQNCADAVPDQSTSSTLNISAIDLTNLPSTLHCGQLDVPMDYSKKMCEDNMITIGLAMHRPAKPKGALFFNPGGTDAGVIVAWDIALNPVPWFDGLLDFDILVLDVRGTFSSNQLNVSIETLTPLFGAYPTNQSEYDYFKNLSAAGFQSWIDHSSPPGIIQHVGTREVVQDYEQVRKALGYEKINFLGASYGTFRVAQYAANFPHRVGNFVLDSVVPHGSSFTTEAINEVAANNRAMERADAYCLNNSSCPFYGQGKGSVIAAFKQVLAAAQASPFFIPDCVNNTACFPYITGNDVQSLMADYLQGAPDFPAILEGLYAAINGVPAMFINGPPPLEAVVGMPLECNDYEFERTFEAFNESMSQSLKIDTTGIGQAGQLFFMLICSAWPYPVPSNVPLPNNKKMLFVTGEFEASAPTEETTLGWEQSPKSALVVRHGDDHVSFLLPYAESSNITKAFLKTGILPEAKDTESITIYSPGMTRKPVSDPYQFPTGAVAGDIDSGNVTVQVPF